MKEKPLLSNLFINFIRTLLNLLFPVITFSYTSRVLGDTGIGIVNYTDSIVRYLILIGGGGISYYAMREAAGVRERKALLAQRAGELLRLTLGLSGIAYLLLLFLLMIGAGKEYTAVLLVQSLIVLFNALGMEWLYNALEEYRYITIRTAACQGIACVLLLLLVREEQDHLRYALIVTGASVGMQLVNFIHARKLLVPVSGEKGGSAYLGHWHGARYVFFANLAISVYVHIDKTMLGNMCGMETVGRYSAAHHIIQAVAGLLTCVTNVLLPRVSFYLEEGREEEVGKLLQKTGDIIALFAIPAAAGTVCVGRELLTLLGGKGCVQAFPALAVLAAGLLFSVFNNHYIWQVMIPYKREREAFYGTLSSAVINIGLNLLLIPIGGMAGAAVATVAAEAALFMLCRVWTRGYHGQGRALCRVFQPLAAAGIGIVMNAILIGHVTESFWGGLFLKVGSSMLLYPGILWLMGNETVRGMVHGTD